MNNYISQNGSLEFHKRLLNASGSLAFAPVQKKRHLWSVLDAFVSNPISFRPRKAATNRALLNYPGGALQHSGLPNPGIKHCLKKYGPQWAKANIPIIPALIADDPSQLSLMVRQLEELENLIAINLLIGEGFSSQLVRDLIQAAQSELPIIASIAMERALELSESVIQAGATVIALGPSRGSMMDDRGQIIKGRLYGPNQFPRALYVTEQLAEMQIPIIGGNGIYSNNQAQMMLNGGAIAVQLDSVLWMAEWDEKAWQINKD